MCMYVSVSAVGFDNFGNLISIIVFKEQHMPTKRWIAKIDRKKNKQNVNYKRQRKQQRHTEQLNQTNENTKYNNTMCQHEHIKIATEEKSQLPNRQYIWIKQTHTKDKPSKYRKTILLKSKRKHKRKKPKLKREPKRTKDGKRERLRLESKKENTLIEVNEIRTKWKVPPN